MECISQTSKRIINPTVDTGEKGFFTIYGTASGFAATVYLSIIDKAYRHI